MSVDKNAKTRAETYLPDGTLRSGAVRRNPSIYEIWWIFLAFSPTYFLAHKHECGGLTEEESQMLPKDFGLVLETYRDFGSVWGDDFVFWDMFNRSRLFGIEGVTPHAYTLSHLPSGEKGSVEHCREEVERYLSDARAKEYLPEVLLVAVPVGGSKQRVLREVGALIDEVRCNKSRILPEPPYKVSGGRIHLKKLKRCLELIVLKAEHPDWPLWKIGAALKISHTYKFINPRTAKPSEVSPDARNAMTMMTSRELKKARLIMENAARGKFPSTDEIELPDLDYYTMAEKLYANMEYERERKISAARALRDAWEAEYQKAVCEGGLAEDDPRLFQHWALFSPPNVDEEGNSS